MRSYIISEIGVNWFGDPQIAANMIQSSKEAGADAIKLQMLSEKVIKGYPEELKEKLRPMILNEWQVSVLSKVADDFGLDFIVSTMYPEAFNILENIEHLSYVKIRHFDRNNETIAKKAVEFCKDRNIDILISCTNSFDFAMWFKDCSCSIHPLYCVPKYPPELHEINLMKISTKHFDGYSNHSPNKFVPMAAIAKGFKFIEVHVKAGTNDCDKRNKPLDDAVSVKFSDLRDICEFRDTIASLGGR